MFGTRARFTSGTTEYKVEQSSFNPGAGIIKRHSNGHVGRNFVGAATDQYDLVRTVGGWDYARGVRGLRRERGADVLMYYRKGPRSGLRVSDATETHIS